MAKITQKEAQALKAKLTRARSSLRTLRDKASENQDEIRDTVVCVAAGGLAGYAHAYRDHLASRGETVMWDLVEAVPAEGILGAGVYAVSTQVTDGTMSSVLREAGKGMMAYSLGTEIKDRATFDQAA